MAEEEDRVREQPTMATPPMGQAKVPPFSEPNEEMTARQFINLTKSVARSYSWTPEQTTGAAVAALKGKAWRWSEWTLEHDPKAFDTFNKFEEAFLDRFRGSKSIGEQVKIYSNLKQEATESSQDFFERVDTGYIQITRDIIPTDSVRRKGAMILRNHFAILAFINGLRPQIRAILEAQVDLQKLEHEETDKKVKAILEIAARAENSIKDVKPAQIAEIQQRDGPSFTANSGRFQPPRGGRGRARGRGGRGRGRGQNWVQQGSWQRSPAREGNDDMARRKRWVFCKRCHKWGRHYARECPLSFEQIAALEPDNEDAPPTGEPYDANFPQTLRPENPNA